MRMRLIALAVACLACLSGCSAKDPKGWVGFVINQDEKSSSSSQVPGKSYSASPTTFTLKGASLRMEAGGGEDIRLELDVPVGKTATQELLAKTVPIQGGKLVLAGQTLDFEQGSFTLQTLVGGVGRGNFNARVKNHNPPWEVVGCFEAPCVLP